MKKVAAIRQLSPLLTLCLALTLTSCVTKVETPGESQERTDRVTGRLRVQLTLQTSETSRSSSVVENVTAIQFEDEYIVLTVDNAGGRVVPIHRIQEFSWTR